MILKKIIKNTFSPKEYHTFMNSKTLRLILDMFVSSFIFSFLFSIITVYLLSLGLSMIIDDLPDFKLENNILTLKNNKIFYKYEDIFVFDLNDIPNLEILDNENVILFTKDAIYVKDDFGKIESLKYSEINTENKVFTKQDLLNFANKIIRYFALVFFIAFFIIILIIIFIISLFNSLIASLISLIFIKGYDFEHIYKVALAVFIPSVLFKIILSLVLKIKFPFMMIIIQTIYIILSFKNNKNNGISLEKENIFI